MQEIHASALTPEIESFIFEGFRQHDIETVGETGVEAPVCLAIKDKNGDHLSAVVYQLFWGAVHIKYAYTKEKHRKQGYATQLLQAVFDIAKQQHSPFVYVETMSFQALPFYQNLGFHIDFKREGYAHGSCFYYLSKVIA